MKANFREKKTRLHLAQVAFGALIFLTALAFVAAIRGNSTEAQLPSINVAGSAQPPGTLAGKIVSSSTPTSTQGSGGKIAFTRNYTSTGNEIAVMNDDGSNVVRLTTQGGDNTHPDWSPDGSQIVFMSVRNDGGEIFVMNSDGSNQHNITNDPSVGDGYPAWSPLGDRIAIETGRFDSSVEIATMNPDGSNIVRLTNNDAFDDEPDWSPDASKIVFESGRDDPLRDIYVMNADGGNVVRLTNNPAYDLHPAWSPDGSKIAFVSTRDGNLNYEIYVMNANGSNQIRLTNNPAIDNDPTWSPDSSQIAFFSYRSGRSQIYVMNADGSNQHSISNPPVGYVDDFPSWASGPKVLVQNAQGTPVAGAEVYTNTQGPGYPSTFIGTTNMSGTIPLPNPVLGEYLIARSVVYTGTTIRGSHDGWAYHVWSTNIVQQSNGQQNAYIVADPTLITQTLEITTTSPLIGFNIVASVEYNATPDSLSTIAQGLSGKETTGGFHITGASDFLLDVSDGQMFFEKVTVYEDKQHWNDADYQFFASYPRPDSSLRSDLITPFNDVSKHIHAHGPNQYGIPWDQTNAYSFLVHEFSHYAIGARDEYFYLYDGDNADCSLVTEPDFDKRASIMADNRVSSEYCTQNNHNPLTSQGLLNGESVWDTLVSYWTDTQNRWKILSPTDRGYVDPGPNLYIADKAEQAVPAIVSVGVPSCSPILVTVTDNDIPVPNASLSLEHNNTVIEEGRTDINGQARIYGAVVGQDKVTAMGPVPIPFFNDGSADITSCNAITIPLGLFLAPAQANQPATQWPTHWLTATADFNQNQVHVALHFVADPPAQPTMYGSQGGTGRQQVTLTYDPATHSYSGSYPLDPNRSLDFQFEVGLSGAQGVALFPYSFVAAQFHASGPDAPSAGSKGKVPVTTLPPAPSIWDLFPPENMVSLSVSSTSLISGTGVMVGQVDTLADPPNGLLAVGGPYSVQGENPISGTVYMSLEYQSEYFCGLQVGSTRVYRYNGTGWDALPTTLNEEWHLAATTITQWGIYAVFAQPNPQAVFTDVPSGSTFYTYINWITCHGIASGYSNGTFRPNNNATRGQISKMVALAYLWRLEAPQGQGDAKEPVDAFQWRLSIPADDHTFADVLPGSTFYLYIEAAYREGVISGYPCGGATEPCDPQHRPYFRPGNNVTRGQIAKIISNAALFDDEPTGQTFEDVPPTQTFYMYIERMASRGVINGYSCGGAGEPCVPPSNLPYFRPGNNASRGQLSKMIYLALQPR